ncbi:MAG: lysostaphin resistance A-like protein [Sphingobacteriaceae bacterium]
MSENSGNIRKPFFSFLYLVFLMFLGTLVFSLLGFLIGILIYGSAQGVGFLKTLQIVSSIGTFLIPAWVYARSENPNALQFFTLNKAPNFVLLFLTVAVMFSSSASMEWIIEWNRGLHLPGFLNNLENWMRQQESQMQELIKKLSFMQTKADFALNLVMLALLPAIGEELIFRGCIQKISTRFTKNHHLGIWITAIIFSAIHLQFYGFFPRMLLGALFGYLLVWSNNLWFPIIAHFINNSLVVIGIYWGLKQGETLESLEKIEKQPNYVYFFSVFLTGSILWLFYQYSSQKSIKH